jgi:hypothetical protein
MNKKYRKQVTLVLDVLPEIVKEKNLALHGGTAINLFVRNMPRLSVDIDLTYIPISNGQTSLEAIVHALKQIDTRLKKLKPGIVTMLQEQNLKLQVSFEGAQIKIEVSQINRGCIAKTESRILCEKAQELFDSFCEASVVPKAQLFGGKIIAALDRQHPRDLFDVKHLLDGDAINDELKPGIILGLISSNRPIYELLNPIRKDQQLAFENQFKGMTTEPFSYVDYEESRETMIMQVNDLLKEEDKAFLLNFKKLAPQWDKYDYREFPAVKWKMENLKAFKENNVDGFNEAVGRLALFLE